MPIVIQRRREPTGLDQLGKGMIDAVQTYLQGSTQLANQQSDHARNMTGLGMMGSRMKREERMDALAAQKEAARAALGQKMQTMDFKSPDAQQDLMRMMADAPDMVGGILSQISQQKNFEAAERARRDSLGLAQSARSDAQKRWEAEQDWSKKQANKPTLIQATDEFGNPTYKQYFPDGRIVPINMQGQQPQVQPLTQGQVPTPPSDDAMIAQHFGLVGGQNPSPDAVAAQSVGRSGLNPSDAAVVAQQLGLVGGQAQEQVPPVASTNAEIQAGSVIGPDGQEVFDIPQGVKWGDQKKELIGGREWYVQKAGAMKKIIGPVPDRGENRPLPINAIANISATLGNLAHIRQAGVDVNENPEATGRLKSWTPDYVLNRFDPEGITSRANLANFSSMVIHDRSGAAVSVAEFPRLSPFIPNQDDNALTIQKKLEGFYRVVREETLLYLQSLKDSGYNVPESMFRNAQVQFQVVQQSPHGTRPPLKTQPTMAPGVYPKDESMGTQSLQPHQQSVLGQTPSPPVQGFMGQSAPVPQQGALGTPAAPASLAAGNYVFNPQTGNFEPKPVTPAFAYGY